LFFKFLSITLFGLPLLFIPYYFMQLYSLNFCSLIPCFIFFSLYFLCQFSVLRIQYFRFLSIVCLYFLPGTSDISFQCSDTSSILLSSGRLWRLYSNSWTRFTLQVGHLRCLSVVSCVASNSTGFTFLRFHSWTPWLLSCCL
jgi:hypothetical protein